MQKIAGPGCTVEEARQRPWCSATFVGAQHGIVLRLAGAEAMGRARALAEQLPEAAFAIPNHIVVEVVIDALVPDEGDALMTLAILTIEDW